MTGLILMGINIKEKINKGPVSLMDLNPNLYMPYWSNGSRPESI